MIITSNYGVESLSERLDYSVFSRLVAICKVVEMCGIDYRMKDYLCWMCEKQKAFRREITFDPDAFSVCIELTSRAFWHRMPQYSRSRRNTDTCGNIDACCLWNEIASTACVRSRALRQTQGSPWNPHCAGRTNGRTRESTHGSKQI